MLPLSKILCPTDFSKPSFEALRVAAEFAQHFSASLLLLHVATPLPVLPQQMSSSFDVQEYHAELIASGKKQLVEVINAHIPPTVSTIPLVVPGEASDEIVHQAKTNQVEMIIIATHGITGWRRFIAGSVTEKVVRLSPCPVLAIRWSSCGDGTSP